MENELNLEKIKLKLIDLWNENKAFSESDIARLSMTLTEIAVLNEKYLKQLKVDLLTASESKSNDNILKALVNIDITFWDISEKMKLAKRLIDKISNKL